MVILEDIQIMRKQMKSSKLQHIDILMLSTVYDGAPLCTTQPFLKRLQCFLLSVVGEECGLPYISSYIGELTSNALLGLCIHSDIYVFEGIL